MHAFESKAQRKATYSLLSNQHVTRYALSIAAWNACAARAAHHAFAYVPLDGSSISLRDPYKLRGTGPVGPRSCNARGFIAMNAIAVSPAGAALGICGQAFWKRTETKAKKSRIRRKFAEKESHRWVQVAQHVAKAFKRAGHCKPWFQLDRAGDAGDVLLHAVKHDWLITVRAAHNRRLMIDGPRVDLWTELAKQPVMGEYFLPVAPNPKRTERTARMRVRACRVTLRLRNKWTKTIRNVTLGVVLAREEGTTPTGEKPLEWMLYTTAPMTSWEEVQGVVQGYVHRWKIEQFHYLWKSGHCNVEATCLHKRERILKWSAILSSVAMRVLELTQQSRAEPESPASKLLSADEIEALILLRNPRGFNPKQMPSVGQAVLWLGELGGFMGRGKGVPPGPTVVGRGLEKLGPVIIALQTLKQRKATAKRGAKKRSGER